MKVMIVVTHLLGTGHLTRALTLARAFSAAGHDVRLVSGGVPVARLAQDDVPVIQLPPVQSDGVDFTRLLDRDGALTTEDQLAERRSMLCETLLTFRPDALITELFPFGRRNLRGEFRALLQQADRMARRPVIFASVRDILAPPGKPSKIAFAEDLVADYYRAVLVHSDARLMPLDLSWPVGAALRSRLHYTGFVAPPPAPLHPAQTGEGEIIVSAGGGAVGTAVFTAARAAAMLDKGRVWRILVGGADAQDRISALRLDAPENLTVEAARPDFRQMLHHADASVSLCGYNTALDILQTSCPAVFVPFDEGNEAEQGIRAAALAERAGLEHLPSAALSGAALLDAVAKVTREGRRAAGPVQADGAQETVRYVAACVGARDAD